ncbi:hypothetical protein C8Q77DRAFT_733446 [Trametes polyzona]|nr:hypothetical protein C8Q77DRAFT_733446 [Trametes polyzona]
MSRSRRRQRKASRKPITISASSAASRPRTTLQSLNSDVLSAILDFLDRLDAIALASASRWIRRCCTHVHRLTIKGDYLPEDNDPGYFSVLAHLPSLSSVTFHYAFRGVPWMGVQACLKFPNITALSFTHTSQWLVPGRPEEYRWILDTLPAPGASGIPSRIPLTAFSYTTLVWRELREHSEAARFPHTATLAEEYAAEARGLAPLVPAMQDTAESLRLPLDTSPVQEMCEGYWPRLSDLSFRGSYPQSMPLSAMSTLLSRMPRLRNLSLEIAQPRSHSRAPIFGANAPKGCEYLPLRSLTVAYPDPDDAIFTSVGADLTRLSIRDWPRYYYPFRGEIDLKWSAPILSSSECLRLLTRMNVPHLRRLEVVYKVNGPDDDLLRHIATSYPDLEEFEIHRYRADNDKDEPPYVKPHRPPPCSAETPPPPSPQPRLRPPRAPARVSVRL